MHFLLKRHWGMPGVVLGRSGLLAHSWVPPRQPDPALGYPRERVASGECGTL